MGKTRERAKLDTRRPAGTSGSEGFAASLRSSAELAQIKLSFPSAKRFSAGISRQDAECFWDFTAGVYPMLVDETCWFLAADFDKKFWMRDVAAFRDTARARGVPVAIERARSGNGAHAWIFFAEPIR
jgi:hypothetical protein